jgi:hypothetical protein
MGLFDRLEAWRAAKREEREAIVEAADEARRAGDEPPRSLGETVDDAAGTMPPPN